MLLSLAVHSRWPAQQCIGSSSDKASRSAEAGCRLRAQQCGGMLQAAFVATFMGQSAGMFAVHLQRTYGMLVAMRLLS